jgi:hypothetical protein
MRFETDSRMVQSNGREFGEYMLTFISERGQVRADFFRRGKIVTAYVSFPTGLDATTAADSYITELWGYAREHGFPDQFKVVLSYRT